ncbi:MAG TPA: L,D-transpeptidase [Actinomycetota bacterium]|nr:L,D-transpeptidase [Actinomycetota bacterium]
MTRGAVALWLALLVAGCAGPDAPAGDAQPGEPAAGTEIGAFVDPELRRPLPAPAPAPGPLAARPLGRYVAVYPRPGAPAPGFVLDVRNPTGELAPLLVRDVRPGGWVEVLLPLRPNGTTGWVRAEDARLFRPRLRIEVDLSERTLLLERGGRVLRRIRVGIGRPTTPTPTGRFYVWVKVPQRNPRGPYGSLALGLSGFSEVLERWPGEGRLAIHGTVDPGDRGARVSAGCIRVYNPDLRALRRVPLGTPVVIHR